MTRYTVITLEVPDWVIVKLHQHGEPFQIAASWCAGAVAFAVDQQQGGAAAD